MPFVHHGAFLARRRPRRRRKPTLAASERATTEQAMAILGVKLRKLQAMSARGEIPGAALMGRQWTYDLTKLRRFVMQKEQETCRRSEKPHPDAIGVVIPSGAALRFAAKESGGRLKQTIQRLRKNASRRESSAR